MYADKQTKANIDVKDIVQITFDKPRALNFRFDLLTHESNTSYLLSPVLLKPKARPGLVLKSATAAAVPPYAASLRQTTYFFLSILPAAVFLPCVVLLGTDWILPQSSLPPPPGRCTRGGTSSDNGYSAHFHVYEPRTRPSCTHLLNCPPPLRLNPKRTPLRVR